MRLRSFTEVLFRNTCWLPFPFDSGASVFIVVNVRNGQQILFCVVNNCCCDGPNTMYSAPQCETIVEQHEDEIIEFFAHETDNVKDKLCSKRTGMFFTLVTLLV